MTEVDELHARLDTLEMVSNARHEVFRSTRSDARVALDVARQSVKLMTALRATQLEHGDAIAGLAAGIAEIKTDVAELRDGLAEVLRRLPG